jgi:membrane-associated phospholipid phosphatase
MTAAFPSFLRKPVVLFSIVLVILFGFSLLIEKGDDILLINGNHTPFGDWFFKSVTHLVDGFFIIPCTLLLALVRYRYALVGLLAFVINAVLMVLFKQFLFYGAPRPRKYIARELIHFVDGVYVAGRNSFPSGHTAAAFCFAFVIAYVYKNNRVTGLMLLFALIIGYSRIYLAQHFLIDVAAGAIVGSFAALASCVALEAAKLPWWANQKLSLPANRKLTYPGKQR